MKSVKANDISMGCVKGTLMCERKPRFKHHSKRRQISPHALLTSKSQTGQAIANAKELLTKIGD